MMSDTACKAVGRAAASCWAKSRRDDPAVGLSLTTHMADSARVAGRLWDDFLPRSVRALVDEVMPGEGEGRRLLVWLSAAHDLGKASRAFGVQVEPLASRMEACGLGMGMVTVRTTRPPHSIVSQLLLERWLEENHGWDRDTAQTYAVVPGGHHGVTPSRADLDRWACRSDVIGDDTWIQAQDELATYASALAGIELDLPVWAQRRLPAQAQVVLTGTIIVADWIASNEDLFPYEEHAAPGQRVERAWTQLQLPGPWQPVQPAGSADSLLRQRFGFQAGVSARPVQRTVIELANEVDKPGLLVIEAPMGEGKTEAALAAAEIFARRTGSGGVFVALPTMATSNAMFARVKSWVENVPDARGPGQERSMFLAHGKAGLNDDYAGLMASGSVAAVGDDNGHAGSSAPPPEVVIAHEWLFGRKKGPLANFVVGTIDQVLFAGLKSRHLVLRHLALSSKVVIIDEVHAADAYMGVYLCRVLTWLGAYGVPTILLSATLPPGLRRRLVDAYQPTQTPQAGAAGGGTGKPLSRAAAERLRAIAADQPAADPLTDEVGYPLLVATSSTAPLVRSVEASGRVTSVQVDRLADDDDALVQLLRTRLRQGGCAAIIRNTVARAQQTLRLLDTEFPGSASLTHARFLDVDRAAKDSDLLTRFGPTSTEVSRAGTHIVVGTQVLEQSLDVDFDLLVSDAAPLDLLFQRMGRLHRHSRGDGEADRPAPLREARCVLVGVDDWGSILPTPVGGSSAVYGLAPLLRALAVLERHGIGGRHVVLPDDIAPLVRQAYEPGFEPPLGWEPTFAEADALRARERLDAERRAETFALEAVPRAGRSILGWTQGQVGDVGDSARGQAQVRDTEDTLEVLVVQSVRDEIRTLPWLPALAGAVVPVEAEPRRSLARAVAGCAVRLPAALLRPWCVDSVIRSLEQNAFAGWQQSPWLKGQLVLVLDENLTAEIPEAAFVYDRRLGLIVTFKSKEDAR